MYGALRIGTRWVTARLAESPTPQKFAATWSKAFDEALAPHVRNGRVDVGVAAQLGPFGNAFRLVMTEHLQLKSGRLNEVSKAAHAHALESARASTLPQTNARPRVEKAYLPAHLREGYEALHRPWATANEVVDPTMPQPRDGDSVSLTPAKPTRLYVGVGSGADVVQARGLNPPGLPDCYLAAPASALANLNFDLIRDLIDHSPTTERVTFNFAEKSVEVDRRLYWNQHEGNLRYGKYGGPDQRLLAIWWPLLEKAYVQVRRGASYKSLEFGYPAQAFRELLGQRGTVQEMLTKRHTSRELMRLVWCQFRDCDAIVCASNSKVWSPKLSPNHCYEVANFKLGPDEKPERIFLWNPGPHSPSTKNDHPRLVELNAFEFSQNFSQVTIASVTGRYLNREVLQKRKALLADANYGKPVEQP